MEGGIQRSRDLEADSVLNVGKQDHWSRMQRRSSAFLPSGQAKRRPAGGGGGSPTSCPWWCAWTSSTYIQGLDALVPCLLLSNLGQTTSPLSAAAFSPGYRGRGLGWRWKERRTSQSAGQEVPGGAAAEAGHRLVSTPTHGMSPSAPRAEPSTWQPGCWPGLKRMLPPIPMVQWREREPG